MSTTLSMPALCCFVKYMWILPGILLVYNVSFSQQQRPDKKTTTAQLYPAATVDISEHLKIFNVSDTQAMYSISLCADVPYNKKPLQVAYRQETGHVFLILQKITQHADTISRVFGFYPKRGLQALLFKRTKSIIRDNSGRCYDVSVTKMLTAVQFDSVLVRAVTYAKKKYHVNRYNCYDYAMLIFNSVSAESRLPLRYVRFPFIFGRGGSPCSVYRELKALKEAGSAWSSHIAFGDMLAPAGTRDKAEPVKHVDFE